MSATQAPKGEEKGRAPAAPASAGPGGSPGGAAAVRSSGLQAVPGAPRAKARDYKPGTDSPEAPAPNGKHAGSSGRGTPPAKAAGPKLPAVAAWAAERLPLEKLSFQTLVLKKEVPVHRMSCAYYTGGLVLLFFAVQALTGLLLLFHYEPTVSDAHASVEHLTHQVPGGALIRNLHAWSASAMIFCLLVHLLMALATKAFARPREITWIAGVLLLFITFAFGFTGYLLPWSHISVNATKVVLTSIEQVGQYLPAAVAHLPVVLREAIQGEASIGQATLSRFYAIHVVVLPLLILGVIGLHLLMVQVHGMSRAVEEAPRKSERFFPTFLLKDLNLWAAAFGVVFVLARCLPFDAFLPFPLSQPFNALGSTPEGIKPEWYFFPMYYPMEMLPFWAILIGMGLLHVGLFLVPWIFRGTSHKVMRWIALGAAAYLVTITVFGHRIYLLVTGAQP